MYLARTPAIVQRLLPGLVWHIPNANDQVFLTFDDGPTPEVTPWVIEELARHDARATFFCVGKNVEEHHEIFTSLQQAGHAIGNHTYDHCDGWRTDDHNYLRSVERCQVLVHATLFRPPYGKITPGLSHKLRDQYKVIMWDVLSGDFDRHVSGEQCAVNVIDNVRPGSIVVFHDSRKAWPRLKVALPKTLGYLADQGWVCDPLG